MAKIVAAFVVLAAGAQAGPECPSSGSFIHASTSVEVVLAKTSCNLVNTEILARIKGQSTGAWHDPHNNGTYSLDSGPMDLPKVELHRVTGDKKYTDKMILSCQEQGCSPAGCSVKLSGCSASQVFSVADFSTNYCNLRMLYCGSADGCKPLKSDFTYEEISVRSSIGASHDPNACLKVSSEPASVV
eukprot:TRINITY_DN7984_c0_g1_i1.p1 TRINITY_DN7984_c0_g1~~TRINITY_DN7984_c0_g1_i1.p1  ORF type:complete len:187 (+),score=29.93 TRINITY_DN7984_c0_g1_i1:64-624(+)